MTMLSLLSLLGAGVIAGSLTTIAGLGGGILLIAALSQVWAPAMVLGVTAPALMVGNVSRVALLLKEVQWRLLGWFALTGLPAAFIASLLAAGLPTRLLRVAIAVLLLAFVAQELLAKGRRTPSTLAAVRRVAAVAGLLAGIVSGLTGGAGFVAAPLLERLGLKPTHLVATSAAGMGLIHFAKSLGFGMSSVLTPSLLPAAAILAGGIVVGNALGTHVLRRLPKEVFRRILLTALVLAAVQLLVVSA